MVGFRKPDAGWCQAEKVFGNWSYGHIRYCNDTPFTFLLLTCLPRAEWLMMMDGQQSPLLLIVLDLPLCPKFFTPWKSFCFLLNALGLVDSLLAIGREMDGGHWRGKCYYGFLNDEEEIAAVTIVFRHMWSIWLLEFVLNTKFLSESVINI